jgi:histidinol-phosphate aminotransferase
MSFDAEQIVRPNIRQMTPYSSARHEFSGEATIFLDANENAFGSPLPENFNRYPDPLQKELKEKVSSIKGVPPDNIFLGNGSDEAIDLLFRIFCEPGKDNVILFPPTYGMYEVCAAMNDVTVRKVPLNEQFQPDLEATAAAIDQHSKLIFVCSPNNPTGNSMDPHAISMLLNNFDGLVVVDEAYINYARQKTLISELTEYPNLVILQTLSKAWGLAGLRIGMAFAGEPVISYMNKVKYPYNISSAAQQLALEALGNISSVNNWTRTTVEQRDWLAQELLQFPFTRLVYPSDANFLLVKMDTARNIYDHLAAKGIIVRDRSRVILCNDCLRITIGTPDENKQLVAALKMYKA